MHPLFVASDHPPVAPGSSPFHFRGFYYDRLFARVRGMPSGMQRLLSELKDDRVREFAVQRFSWNGWYDALPSMPIYAALARIENTNVVDWVRNATRDAAESLVPSVLRMTMDLTGGPGTIAAVVTKFVMHTADFGTARFVSIGAESAVANGVGIPLCIAPNITGLVLGGFEGVLRSGGATDVSAGFDDIVLQSRTDAYERVSIRYDFRWRMDPQRRSSALPSSRLATAITNRFGRAK